MKAAHYLMKTAIWLLCCSGLLGPSVALAEPRAASAPPALYTLPYDQIAKDLAERWKLDLKHPEAVQYEDILAQKFACGRFGILEVYWPVHTLEKQSERLGPCIQAVINAQLKWLDWLAQDGAEPLKEVRKDLEILADYGWDKPQRAGQFQSGKNGNKLDMYDLVVAPPAVKAAGERAYQKLITLDILGPAREHPTPSRLIFTPTREDFVQFNCFFGWIRKDLRDSYWVDGIAQWTTSFINSDQVICLQFAAGEKGSGDYKQGSWMEMNESGDMQQQVVQLAMNSLSMNLYTERVPGAFITGLSMNIVYDLYKQINTRIDGATKARATAAREMFVPGGQSSGGTLPKISAENRWRSEAGLDHFTPILRAVQREGAELAKKSRDKQDKRPMSAYFAIKSDSGGKEYLLAGPFLGAAAIDQQRPPEEFRDEFEEFLRAYKSCFMNWLQTKAGKDEKDSRQRFAKLLKRLADPNLVSEFVEVFKEVYDGTPLSSTAIDKDCLEGRFLIWLNKQKGG
jgi:hypothetical protein